MSSVANEAIRMLSTVSELSNSEVEQLQSLLRNHEDRVEQHAT